MLCGGPPFSHKNETILLNKIKSGSYAIPEGIDSTAESIIRGLLTIDVSALITLLARATLGCKRSGRDNKA